MLPPPPAEGPKLPTANEGEGEDQELDEETELQYAQAVAVALDSNVGSGEEDGSPHGGMSDAGTSVKFVLLAAVMTELPPPPVPVRKSRTMRARSAAPATPKGCLGSRRPKAVPPC